MQETTRKGDKKEKGAGGHAHSNPNGRDRRNRSDSKVRHIMSLLVPVCNCTGMLDAIKGCDACMLLST